jgi:high affinity sulfate transporter 1
LQEASNNQPSKRNSSDSVFAKVGLPRTYGLETLRFDLLAALAVTAVEVPTAMAYAELAGFSPVIGLYSSILPLVAYALVGSSRQLIVGPDAATCTIVAAALVPVAAQDPVRYLALSMALSLIVGVMCIVAGFLKLGFVGDFLSRPILSGFMNGVALTIISKQLGNFCGFALIGNTGFFLRVVDFVERLAEIHVPTLVVGAATLLLIWGVGRLAPRVPGPLVGVAGGILIATMFHLEHSPIALVGAIPAGFPVPRLPSVSLDDLQMLSGSALAILIVSFCSAIATAKSFATRNGYEIDANRELIALGAANLTSGISQGFAVSGADSRTAISDVSGGRTQMTGMFAAVLMTLVLLLLTRPLSLVPKSSLAAVLIAAGVSLLDIATVRHLYKASVGEFWVAIVATLGVITIGVVAGITIAIVLAVITLLWQASRPHDAILGLVPGSDEYHDMEQQPDARPIAGLLIYRFDASLVFFNAGYFKQRVRAVVAAATIKPRTFLFDAEAMTTVDMTGAYALEEMRAELERHGIGFMMARARTALRERLYSYGMFGANAESMYPSIRSAVQAFEAGELK